MSDTRAIKLKEFKITHEQLKDHLHYEDALFPTPDEILIQTASDDKATVIDLTNNSEVRVMDMKKVSTHRISPIFHGFRGVDPHQDIWHAFTASCEKEYSLFYENLFSPSSNLKTGFPCTLNQFPARKDRFYGYTARAYYLGDEKSEWTVRWYKDELTDILCVAPFGNNGFAVFSRKVNHRVDRILLDKNPHKSHYIIESFHIDFDTMQVSLRDRGMVFTNDFNCFASSWFPLTFTASPADSDLWILSQYGNPMTLLRRVGETIQFQQLPKEYKEINWLLDGSVLAKKTVRLPNVAEKTSFEQIMVHPLELKWHPVAKAFSYSKLTLEYRTLNLPEHSHFTPFGRIYGVEGDNCAIYQIAGTFSTLDDLQECLAYVLPLPVIRIVSEYDTPRRKISPADLPPAPQGDLVIPESLGASFCERIIYLHDKLRREAAAGRNRLSYGNLAEIQKQALESFVLALKQGDHVAKCAHDVLRGHQSLINHLGLADLVKEYEQANLGLNKPLKK